MALISPQSILIQRTIKSQLWLAKFNGKRRYANDKTLQWRRKKVFPYAG